MTTPGGKEMSDGVEAVKDLAQTLMTKASAAPRMPDSWADADLSWGSPWDGWNPDEAFQLGYETAMNEAAALVATTTQKGTPEV